MWPLSTAKYSATLICEKDKFWDGKSQIHRPQLHRSQICVVVYLCEN
jgi:hypothetical protein